MSYALVPYLIDLAKLRAAVDGGDAALVRAVRATRPEQFDSADDGLSLGEALSRLVMGRDLGGGATHQYGYALERLCRHLGRVLDVDEWDGVGWAALADSGVDEVLASGPPVALPKIANFPVIGFLDRGLVGERLRRMGLEGVAHEDEELRELLGEFEGWLRTAEKAKLDLVFFYY